MSDEQPKRRKFKLTRELIKIALDDGMTQEEIAKLCRSQQSAVSNWKNGRSKATEQQLEPLLKRYGARLRRSAARVYFLGETNDRSRSPQIRVVEGPLVFRHVFTRLIVHPSRRGGELVHEPVRRWLVHEQPGQIFVLVSQQRRSLSGWERERELEQAKSTLHNLSFDVSEVNAALMRCIQRKWIETNDDAARWESVVEAARTLPELLARVDRHEFDMEHERTTVRFLLRKALIEHGHAVPGVVDGTPAT